MLFTREKLKAIQEIIGITFRNPALLEQVFIHRSYLNEVRRSDLRHNERLEFLGDKVLGLALSKFLFQKLPDTPEGRLTDIFGVMASGRMLTDVSESLGLDKFLFMSKGEKKDFDARNRSRIPIMENVFEALIAAIYLDRGLGMVELFLQEALFPKLDMVISKQLYFDAKSYLQNEYQNQYGITLHYKVLEVQGEAHNCSFAVAVFSEDTQLATGNGRSRKSAEIDAAHNALESEFQIILERFY